MRVIKYICLSAMILSPGVYADEVEVIRVTQAGGNTSQSNNMVLIVQQLQEEVRSLRGQVESQQYELDNLKEQQKDMYNDLDSRLGGSSLKNSSVPASSSATSSTKSSASLTGNEQQDYSDAFEFVKTQELDKAEAAFSSYMKRHPKSSRFSNALYWIGEVNLAQGKLPEASTHFSQLISDYPKSAKVADAMYKLGRVYQRMGDAQDAQDIWQSLIKQYPKTGSATLAKNALQ
ncbi:tol-pal system protein YbgF [Gammaproteobacteria bacterium AS21]